MMKCMRQTLGIFESEHKPGLELIRRTVEGHDDTHTEKQSIRVANNNETCANSVRVVKMT